MERFSGTPLEKKQEAIDTHWFERFQQFGNFETFEYLNGDKSQRKAEQEAFLRGDVALPNLELPLLADFDFDEKERELLLLKRNILEAESDKVIAQAYRWKINEKIADLRMLRAAKNGNDHRFSKYSEFVYGSPDENIFKYTLQKVITAAEKAKDSEQEMIAAAARRILKEFEGISLESPISLQIISAEKAKSFKGEEEIGAEEIQAAFEESLAKYENSGWKIVIEKEKSSSGVHISQEIKKVVIPEGKKAKVSEVKTLIAHEIETHVARELNGKRSKLRLLELGLDRFTKGDEGMAGYAEQKVRGANDFTGMDGHLAISLAKGLDGKKRNFREVFSLLRDYYFIDSKKEVHEAWRVAQEKAYNRCVRTFRGTSCQTPGACYTKDIVYREGNIGIYNVLKENPEEEKRFMIGKYDPANARHIWIMEQLGISDEDLETLEN